MPAGVNEIFPEVHEGDRLSARWLNTLASQVTRLSQANRGRMRTLSNGAGVFTVPEPDDGLLFYNGDATTIPAYGITFLNGVQAAGGPDQAPKVMQPNFYGVREDFIINGQNSVEGTSWGDGQFGNGNIFIAAYDSADGTPAQGDNWGPRSGTYLLKKNTGGFRVIGVIDSTNHWVLVRSAPMYRVLAKTTATINAKSSDSNGCTIYTGAPGAEATTGVTITGAYNYSNCAINASKFVFLDWDNWYNTANLSWFVTLADTS